MTEAFCHACRRSSRRFEPVGTRPEAQCPSCQAKERERFTSLLLDVLVPFLGPGRRVLEIAPSPILRRVLTGRFGDVEYIGLDLGEDREVDVWADLTALPFPDDAFDLVVCSHVLEHVPDDRAAMRELARVTGPDRPVIVFVPYRPDQPTDEGPLAPGETNASRFGQDDHVRWYGHDLDDRLAEAGLAPLQLTPRRLLTDDEIARTRLDPEERCWICVPSGSDRRSADGLLATVLAGRVADRREAGLLDLGPEVRLRTFAALRDRAQRSFAWEREAAQAGRALEDTRRERDAALTRAEYAEAMYRRLAAHPVVRTLRALRAPFRR